MDMLQAHSSLWNYLWVAPNLLLLLLAFLLFRRGIHKIYPCFVAFALIGAIGELVNYAADLSQSISGETFWRIFFSVLVIAALLKFALIGEIFTKVFGGYVSVARLGKLFIRGAGIVLVLAAALAAAFTPQDGAFGIISETHILEQTVHLITAGLLLAVFAMASYFKIRPDRRTFGIALGLGISASVHLATWGLAANAGIPTEKRAILDFINMSTYHGSVLVWYYYLLVPENSAPTPPSGGPPTPPSNILPDREVDLRDWNRELERLTHP
jgi:hypothetical protein